MTNLCPHRIDSGMGQLRQGNKTLNSCLSNKLHKEVRRNQLAIIMDFDRSKTNRWKQSDESGLKGLASIF